MERHKTAITIDFNPRSPHGERRLPEMFVELSSDFNPRSPHGERPRDTGRCFGKSIYFNPRSPHGERRACYGSASCARRISIHAPRTGSDMAKLTARASGIFQSTLPARGATNFVAKRYLALAISIHAPRTGSDWMSPPDAPEGVISIHAPRTGSDSKK